MVAFSGFYESHEPPPSGDTWGIAPPHRDDHQNGQQSGYMFIMIVALAAAGAIRSKYLPDGGVQWLLVKPWSCYRAMRSVSHWRTAMAIEMARGGDTFVCRRRLFRLL